MQIERGHFLALVASLAAGAGGGYVASEKNIVPHMAGHERVIPDRVEPVAPPLAPTVFDAGSQVVVMSAAVDASVAPSCDDSAGDPGACPAVGLPTDEGGCGSLAATRCNDFKKTMKPKVAQAAVACLNKLTGGERCDPKRVELCAHVALMNACDDSAAVTASCDRLANTCGVSRAECKMAMSGLASDGRASMIACTEKHCQDKGVLGCETAAPGKI